jgi:hypothetical protein
MLHERKARGCVLDPKKQTARLEVGGDGGPAKHTVGTLLLDVRGNVVGVDVEPDSAARVVVMVGAHEAVARTVDARVAVSRNARGEVSYVIAYGVEAPR